MGDIPEGAVFIFAAGHCNKQAFRSLDDFDIMYSKVIVHSDGNQCTQAVVRIGFRIRISVIFISVLLLSRNDAEFSGKRWCQR